MRILHITSRLTPGGAEKQLGLLAHGLHERGEEVRVCCIGGEGPTLRGLRAAGILVDVLGAGRALDPRPLSRLWHVIRFFKPEVIHTWRPGGNALGRNVAMRYRRAPIIATAHFPETTEPSWLRWLNKRAHKHTARWIVPGPGLVEFWCERGVPKERIAVIPPGVVFEPGTGRPDQLRRQASLPPNAELILCAGRLLPRKGFKDAIWTLDILKFIHPDVHLVIAGEGPDRTRLEQFAHDIQVMDRVRFLGWRDDLADWLQLADIVWMPSQRDDVPEFLLEALAAGKPIVASRLPALTDVIDDGRTGFLVTPGDKPELAKRTRALLEQPALRERIGTAARAAASGSFSVNDMIDRHLELYHQVVSSRKPTESMASGVA